MLEELNGKSCFFASFSSRIKQSLFFPCTIRSVFVSWKIDEISVSEMRGFSVTFFTTISSWLKSELLVMLN